MEDLREVIPGIPKLIQAFEENLKALADTSDPNERNRRQRFLWGLVFQAQRVLDYAVAGTLEQVEVEEDNRKSRPDLLIREGSNQIYVEVKNWSVASLRNDQLVSSLYLQVKKYLKLGKPVRLEFHLDSEDLPQALLLQLSELGRAAGNRLQIRVVRLRARL